MYPPPEYLYKEAGDGGSSDGGALKNMLAVFGLMGAGALGMNWYDKNKDLFDLDGNGNADGAANQSGRLGTNGQLSVGGGIPAGSTVSDQIPANGYAAAKTPTPDWMGAGGAGGELLLDYGCLIGPCVGTLYCIVSVSAPVRNPSLHSLAFIISTVDLNQKSLIDPLFSFVPGDAAGYAPGGYGQGGPLVEVIESIRETNREQMENINRIVEQQARQTQNVVSTLSNLVTSLSEKKMEISDESLDKLADTVAARIAEKGGVSVGAGGSSSSGTQGGAGASGAVSEAALKLAEEKKKREEEEKAEQERKDNTFKDEVKGVGLKLVAEAESKHDAKKTLNMLYLIFDNMRKHPQQDKYRKVNTSSGRFKERFGNKQSGSDIFTIMGFTKKDANFVYLFDDSLGSDEEAKEKAMVRTVELANGVISGIIEKLDEHWNTAQDKIADQEMGEMERDTGAATHANSQVNTPATSQVAPTSADAGLSAPAPAAAESSTSSSSSASETEGGMGGGPGSIVGSEARSRSQSDASPLKQPSEVPAVVPVEATAPAGAGVVAPSVPEQAVAQLE